jgi:hypothetical protein
MRTSNIQHSTSNIQVRMAASRRHLDVGCWMLNVGCSYFCLLLVLSAATLSKAATTNPTTIPSTQPAVTQPTAADLEVHEWAVFILDGSSGQLNPDGVVTATLPAFVSDKRYGATAAPPRRPMSTRIWICPRRLVSFG